MQLVRRVKPLRSHVRTGCITCKRRRVKRPEERPCCSRCIKAGFVCDGYDTPQAWIFKSRAELQVETDDMQSISFGSCPVQASSTSERVLTRHVGSVPSTASISPLLQLGNSDPFRAAAARLGPREIYLLRMYDVLVTPRFDRLGSRHIVQLAAVSGWTSYGVGIEDESATYGLLARSAGLEHLKAHGSYANSQTSLTKYVAMSQAALRRKLSDSNSLESPDIVYSVMWTSAILLTVDMMIGSLNMHLYSCAMSRMIVRYVELIDPEGRPELILWPVYMEVARSLMTITRCNLDVAEWFPRVFGTMWTKAAALCPDRAGSQLDHPVHLNIQDPVLKDNILTQRDGGRPLLDLKTKDMRYTDTLVIGNAVRSQELWRCGQLLNVATDGMEYLKRSVHVSEQIPEQIHDQIARVYVSLSTLLWMNLTSPTSFASNAILDSTPGLLRQLRVAIMKDVSHRNTLSHQDQPYAVSKLWALFVGVYTECQQRDREMTDPICGGWFLEAFGNHAQSMRIHSWQHAVEALKQVLHSDRLMPHISEWWHQIHPTIESENGIGLSIEWSNKSNPARSTWSC